MLSQRAVIFALDHIIRAEADSEGYRWVLDQRIPSLLRECQSNGHLIFGLFDPMTHGLFLEDPKEFEALKTYITQLLKEAGAPKFAALHICRDIEDPQPIWNWQRHFGLSLRASTFVGAESKYKQLRKNAGIEGEEWSHQNDQDIFEGAYALGY